MFGQTLSTAMFIRGAGIPAAPALISDGTDVAHRFAIDIELSAYPSASPRSHRLADTVSYSNVVATASTAFKGANYKLLERAAGAIADAVLAAFPRVSTIKVTVHKPHAPIAAIFDDVGITLTRGRQ